MAVCSKSPSTFRSKARTCGFHDVRMMTNQGCTCRITVTGSGAYLSRYLISIRKFATSASSFVAKACNETLDFAVYLGIYGHVSCGFEDIYTLHLSGMASEAEIQLPVIDISSATAEVGKQVIDAARQYGFLYIDTASSCFSKEEIDSTFKMVSNHSFYIPGKPNICKYYGCISRCSN